MALIQDSLFVASTKGVSGETERIPDIISQSLDIGKKNRLDLQI